MFAPFSCVQPLPSVAFQIFTPSLKRLAPAPLSLAFQPTSFLFHHFAPSDLVASDLFLSLRPPLRFRRRVRGAREKQAGPECQSKEFPSHNHI
jgi:hypothetical protein